MKKILFHHPVPLLVIFLLLQLGGQTAAGLAGDAEGALNIFTLISYCALILRGLIWIIILKMLPLTTAYPFTGAVYLLILPLSVLVFKEDPGWSRYAGAFLIFAGITLSAFGSVKNGV